MWENVSCKKCGRMESVNPSHLTEEGKNQYLCTSCRTREAMPLEARIAEKADDGRKLLVEG